MDPTSPCDLLLADQDQRILQLALHGLLVRDEVRADVTPVKLHPLDNLELILQRFPILWNEYMI